MKAQETVCPVRDRWDTRVYTEERPVALKQKKRTQRGGGEEKRKELAEEGKKEGAMLGRNVEGNTD